MVELLPCIHHILRMYDGLVVLIDGHNSDPSEDRRDALVSCCQTEVKQLKSVFMDLPEEWRPLLVCVDRALELVRPCLLVSVDWP